MIDIATIKSSEEIMILIAILVILFFWNIFLTLTLAKTKKRSKRFFQGNNAKDLEEVIYRQIKSTKEVEEKIKALIQGHKSIQESLTKCVQKVGVVRFNPFGDVGGNQSFAIALLDNYLNGVIILSLYSRDGVKVYSKQIIEGKSEYNLSEEEIEAIKIASNS